MNRILDGYLNHPGFWDIIIVIALCTVLHYSANIIIIESTELVSIQTSLASTAVSLAGFIIAALTIIVTFKANIKVKQMDDSANGMELLFNSGNYIRIVDVFQFAIVELVACFTTMHGVMFVSGMLTPRHNLLLAIVVLVLILLSVARCLFVLFNVLSVESLIEAE